MTETERVARLLCRAAWGLTAKSVRSNEPGWLDYQVESQWHAWKDQAQGLTAAGLTVLPLEPDEATVEAMADDVPWGVR